MNNNKIKILTAMLFLLFPMVFAGCGQTEISSVSSLDEKSVEAAIEESGDDNMNVEAKIVEVTEEEISTGSIDSEENVLAGTCPKDKHCSSPNCSLYVDNNSNGLCDRGE